MFEPSGGNERLVKQSTCIALWLVDGATAPSKLSVSWIDASLGVAGVASVCSFRPAPQSVPYSPREPHHPSAWAESTQVRGLIAGSGRPLKAAAGCVRS
jgi:hypothetical protein